MVGTLAVLPACGTTEAAPAHARAPMEASPAPSLPEGAPSGWWSQVQQRIAWGEYQLSDDAEGRLSFGNRAQELRARFEGDGRVALEPRVGPSAPLVSATDPWRGSLRTIAWGRAGSLRAFEGGAATPGGCDASGRTDADGECLRRAEIDGAGATEWWGNDERGLEQGWTLRDRPTGDGPVVVEVAVEGLDVEVLGEGTAAVLWAGTSRLRYGSVVAVDARGATLPAWIEAAEAGLKVVVDDAGAEWPVVIDPIVSAGPWRAWSGQEGGNLGYAVSSAGDVNGDGFADVVIGASLYDNGEENEGRAYVFLGSSSGLALGAAWTGEADQANAAFGVAVSSAGDVDGDGYDDVLIGAMGYNDGLVIGGQTYLYQGSSSGLASVAAWTASNSAGGGSFGNAVSSAGDVNGDGYDDVVVGEYGNSANAGQEGRAYIYMGSATGLETSPAWTQDPTNQLNAGYGYDVSSAGDVNGDGYDDVVIGAWAEAAPTYREGRAYLYLGSPAGLQTTASWTGESNQSTAYYGRAVATAGDVNGDGYDDVVVGSHYYDSPENNEGRAFLYLGSPSGLASSATWTAESNQANATFGVDIASAGDVNGDGYDDVVVGAYQFDDGENDEGQALLYLGSSAGSLSRRSWNLKSACGTWRTRVVRSEACAGNGGEDWRHFSRQRTSASRSDGRDRGGT